MDLAIIGFLTDIADCIMTGTCIRGTNIIIKKRLSKNMSRTFQNNSWKPNTDVLVSYVEIKSLLDAADDIYCRSYCMLNMFRAILCPSSGARKYYTDGRCLCYFGAAKMEKVLLYFRVGD